MMHVWNRLAIDAGVRRTACILRVPGPRHANPPAKSRLAGTAGDLGGGSMARLKLLKGQATWSEVPCDAGGTVIGRDPRQAGVVLSDESATISRSHATILCAGGRWFLQDHSKCGTRVNGRHLDRDQRCPVRSGDVIEMCHYVLQFLDDAEEPADPLASVRISDDESSTFSYALDLSSRRRRPAHASAESKLAAIMELAQNLRVSTSVRSLLESALETLLSLFPQADRGVAVTLDPDRRCPKLRVVRCRQSPAGEQTPVVRAADIEEIAAGKAAVLSDDELMIGAPLLGEDEQAVGVVFLDSHCTRGRFGKEGLDVFATVATELAIAVENRRLQEVALKNQELLFELKVANQVQTGLLPAESPRMKEYEFFDHYAPARQVGGDYFDYIDLGNDRVAVVLGDVAGKGVLAALLMSKVMNELNLLLSTGFEAMESIHRVSARLAQRNPRGSFVTMVLALLDPARDEIILVNAGHCSPLLRRSEGEVVDVGRGHSGFPLGIEPQRRHAEEKLTVRSGDTLVLYSDGVTDAQNLEGKRYGEERLRTALTRGPAGARTLGAHVVNEIQQYVGGAEQLDDICLVCIGIRHS
jgi:serine phosphatase RsbU (regulator of sigma subunit)